MHSRILVPLLSWVALAAPPVSWAASNDDNVEWSGISHVALLDRTPRCPLAGQPFALRVQSWQGDLTAVRVRLADGGVSWIDAAAIGTRGPYDIWEAQVPAPVSSAIDVLFELTDGTDIDYLGPAGVSDGLPSPGFVMNFTTLSHAPYGATPTPGGGAVFKVWSPNRTICHVRGEFNSWGTANPMARVGQDFILRVASAADRDMYKYYFQNTQWNTDARARALSPGNNYNAIVEDPSRYDWVAGDFDVPDFEQMVIYQLHVGTFAGLNDPFGAAAFPAQYEDVAERAGHLAQLGVNVVMLCPITEFPGDYSAGYNPVTQWAPESYYGDPDDLKALVDALHGAGIAVILDIVWNHFSYSDNFLWNYDGTQFYFDDPVVETPWGSQGDFDAGGVRDWFAESAHLWLGEYRMDGFRMDATDFMNIAPQEAAGWSLMQRLNDEMDRRWIDKVAIAEQLPDDAWVTRPTSLGGAGFDSQYYDHFTDRLREEILDAALGDPSMAVIADILDGSGQYLSGRHVTNYFELHDEAWPSSGGQRMVKTIDATAPHDDVWAKGRVKLAQGLVLTAPGIPAILQGTEWLEDADFGTDAGNRIDWSHKTTYAGIFQYFTDLIGLRTSLPALRADAGIQAFHVNEGSNVIAFRRMWGDQDIVVVANFSNADFGSYRVGLPAEGEWIELVNSQEAQYEGSGLANPGVLATEAIARDGFAQSVEIALAKMALVVLAPAGDTGVGDPDDPAEHPTSVRLLPVHPNPSRGHARIAFDLIVPARVRVTVYDLSGRLVRVVHESDHPAGRSEIGWDGTDRGGARVSAGIYSVKVEVDGENMPQKTVVIVR
ncbi:MAG: alpha-amylase family glycosyl hydrolase [Candidatus Eisenbacteria bacterium]